MSNGQMTCEDSEFFLIKSEKHKTNLICNDFSLSCIAKYTKLRDARQGNKGVRLLYGCGHQGGVFKLRSD